MSSKQEIRHHFCAELFDQYDGQVDTSEDEFYLGGQYWAWKPAGTSTELPWAKLMPRARVVRWLYAHFLKICMPAKRDPEDEAAVYAPLNLTAFIRLIVRLAERGYPAHWLGTVIENLTSGVIQTTARAPRKVIMDVKDISEIHSPRQITVAPWIAELTTLIGIWRGLMPFGFVVANGAHVRWLMSSSILSHSRTSTARGFNCAFRTSSLLSTVQTLERYLKCLGRRCSTMRLETSPSGKESPSGGTTRSHDFQIRHRHENGLLLDAAGCS